MSNKPIGVIGAGSFGTTVANLLAENSQVLIYARSKDLFEQMRSMKKAMITSFMTILLRLKP